MTSQSKILPYTALKTYCDIVKLTYGEFHDLVDPNHEFSYKTIHKIISGTNGAGKRSGRLLDRWISEHREEIEATLADEPVKEAV